MFLWVLIEVLVTFPCGETSSDIFIIMVKMFFFFFADAASHLASILQHTVCEATVSLRADLHVVVSLEQQGLLQVARALVHVGNAVLAVVCEVLGGLSGKKPQEGQLDVGCNSGGALLSVAELWT